MKNRSFSFRIVGIVISILIALISDNFVNDRVYSWLIFLLSLSIALHLDSIQLIETASRRQETADAVLGLTSKFPWAEENIRGICDSVLEIQSRPALEPFRLIAKSEIETARSILGGLRMGQYSTPISEMLIHFERFEAAQKTIYLTNIDHTHIDWWHSTEGEKYWQSNLAALKHGVKIQRVFIYEHLTPRLKALITRQATASADGRKLDIYVVKTDVLGNELRADIAVWDETFCYQVELNSDGTPIRNRYSVNEADVNSTLKMFKTIRSRASLLDPNDLVITN